ncbi:hypothetical protein Ocepr_2260 (plasmid) [Oceanithermus profundus DSM 14977]|uniref:Uncharacterized protein n=1 Tax=Oceanithermus profundus (strain DSM 14977 / NBRC 100410 / VKM B-2274 / 506) TaxID=670487 RepID=E4UAS3_OCEP5|nr:hypothetical protein [Oceanithermus profundus]ADR37708.1 hypothetical protein Ocepr_2260 [Oceanithermus profundus DSM 14977]
MEQRCCLLNPTASYFALVESPKELASVIDGALHMAGFAFLGAKLPWPKTTEEALKKHEEFARRAKELHESYKQRKHELDLRVANNIELNIEGAHARARAHRAIAELLKIREALLDPEKSAEWALPCDAPEEASEAVASSLCYWSTYWLTELGVSIGRI